MTPERRTSRSKAQGLWNQGESNEERILQGILATGDHQSGMLINHPSFADPLIVHGIVLVSGRKSTRIP